MNAFHLLDMIICGTPNVSFDLGIPDWAVVLILALIFGAYYLGKKEGIRRGKEMCNKDGDLEEE
ncbi:MAG: hypothetical protein ACPGYY_05125 [Bacteroidia bacterium]